MFGMLSMLNIIYLFQVYKCLIINQRSQKSCAKFSTGLHELKNNNK